MLYLKSFGRGYRSSGDLQYCSHDRRPIASVMIALALVIAGAPGARAQLSPASDSGMFTIMSGNRRVGTEKFKIAPGASGLEASGEIEVEMAGAPRVVESSVLQLGRDLRPSSYQRQQKSPKHGSITVQFASPETKLTAKTETGTDDRIFLLPDDHLVVLDTNFFHHYEILLRMYDSAKNGPQRFNVLVPQEATPGTINVEFQGRESQTVGKTARELNHYQAATEDIKIDIWATPQGEIYRMAIPQANLEVVRQ